MAQTFKIVDSNPADRAWHRYAALVQKATADSSLWGNREHIEATFRAHEDFRLAFLAQDRS